MRELHLGTVEAGDGSRRLHDVLGDPGLHLPNGSFDVIGRLDEGTKRFQSGALVRNLGNDQWFVHLINVQQLSRLAQSDLVQMRSEDGRSTALGDALGSEAAIHVAATLLGVGAGIAIAGSLLDVSSTALSTLVTGVDPEAQRIGNKLALEGIDPGSKDAVRKAVSRITESPSPATAGVETSFEPNRAQRSSFALEIER